MNFLGTKNSLRIKLLAVICTVSLLLGVFIPKMFTNAENVTTQLTFSDFAGFSTVTTIGNKSAWDEKRPTQKDAQLNDVSIVGIYNFSAGTVGVAYGCGTYNWNGIHLCPKGTDSLSFSLQNSNGGSLTPVVITPNDYNENNGTNTDLTSLLNTDIKIEISFAYEKAGVSKSDLTVNVIINDVYKNSFVVKDSPWMPINIGAYANSGVGVVLKDDASSTFTKPALTEVSLTEDLGLYGTYKKTDTNYGLVFDVKNAAGFANTFFAQKVEITNNPGSYLNFAGKSSTWRGIRFVINGEDSITVKAAAGEFSESFLLTSDKAGVKLTGTEYELKIELYEWGNKTKLGVYFDGELYDNKEFTLSCPVTNFGEYLSYYIEDSNGNGYFKVAGEAPVPPSKPQLTDLSLTGDMGLAYGKYTVKSGNDALVINENFSTGFKNTSFTQRVELSNTPGSYLNFAGKSNTWLGARFVINGEDSIIVKAAAGEFPETFELTSQKAGVKLTGTEYELKIELYEWGKNQTKLNVYFNGKLYNDQEFTLSCPISSFGGWFSYYLKEKTGYIKISGDTPEIKALTNKMLGIQDGIYTKTDNYVAGSYDGESLVGTSVSFKVKFSKTEGMWFNLAGKNDGWQGIRFITHSDGSITMTSATGNFTLSNTVLTSDIAGVNLLGDEYMFSVELIEVNKNVKMGIYFNGILYNNKYIILKDAAGKLGKHLSFYIPNGEITVGVPDSAPVPNSSFKRLTFDSFGLETARFSGKDLFQEGKCKIDSVNGVIFSDKVNFSSQSGSQLRIFGGNTAWCGLQFSNAGGGILTLQGAAPYFNQIVFNSEVAGVNLTGDDIYLMISVEYVDCDDDKKSDDIKLGIWFNGKPYNNKWFYVKDYAQYLGGYVGIYIPNEKTSFSLETYNPPIDFTEYGFTSNWVHELGLK